MAFLGLVQVFRINEREKSRKLEEDWENDAWSSMREDGARPKRRERIRPTGPWYATMPSNFDLGTYAVAGKSK